MNMQKLLGGKMKVNVRRVKKDELANVAKIHEVAFSRQRYSIEWLKCSYHSFPKSLFYVLESQSKVLGYIIWSQKSGFRPEAILELEQLAILPTHQSKGLGAKILTESLKLVKQQLLKQESKLKHIIVSTRSDNSAQALYRKVLGAEVEAIISNLYSFDEVFMIARNVENRF